MAQVPPCQRDSSQHFALQTQDQEPCAIPDPFIVLESQPSLFSFAQDESKDFAPSSRGKQYGSSEYLSQVDTPGKRPATKMELQDPESNPHAPLGLQVEEQVCEFKGHPEKRVTRQEANIWTDLPAT